MPRIHAHLSNKKNAYTDEGEKHIQWKIISRF